MQARRASGSVVFALALGLIGLGNTGCGSGVSLPSSLAYSTNPAVYTVGTAITPNRPTSSGGAVASYSVNPALPAGLNLDGTTGVISGTPTAITATAQYTVKATNATGSTQTDVTITVNDAAPKFTYPTPVTYVKGTPITPATPTNTGGTVVTYSGAVPPGLTLNANTGAITGTPTTIAPTTQYTITGSNSGGPFQFVITITVNDVPPSNLKYSSNPAVYTKGSAITPNTPSNSGGAVVSYTALTALPAGLSIDGTTGVISGTPSALSPAANYTIQATNSGGSTQATVNITVNDLPPTNLTYSSNPAVYVKGTPITANTPSNSGGGIATYTAVTPLPAGLVLSGTTGIISGTPTAVTAMASYTIQGSNLVGNTQVNVRITVNDVAPNFTYTTPVTYTKGVTIPQANPTNTGGAVVTYSGTVPPGLLLNAGTGAITGIPTTVALATPYTITGTNSGGSGQFIISITVNDVAPGNLTYSQNPAVYTVGTAIPPNRPSSTGGAVTLYTALTPLPAGLALNASTGVISGTPTAAAPAAGYTIQASNSGGNTTASVNIKVNPLLPTRFAYAVNENDATISSFTVDDVTGQLRATGYALVGTTPRWVAVTPSGKFAYVTSVGANNVSAFSISASSGVLTSLGTTTAGTGAFSVAIDPTGSFAYVSNFGSNNVSAFTINASTGALTAVGSAVAAGTGPTAITVDPTGRFVYTVNQTSGDVSAYAINRSTGALTSVGGNVVAGTQPYAVAIDPTGRFAYVANLNSSDVSAFTINQSSGALTSVGATVPAGSNPACIATDPAGKYVFVGNASSNTISSYTINSTTGALTALATPTAVSPSSLVVDPSGTLVYVANSATNQVTTFSLNESTGALAQLELVSARSAPASVAIAQGATAVKYVPTFAYVTNNGTETVQAYTINATTGALGAVGSAATTGTQPTGVTVDPYGRFVYTANRGSNDVSGFTIGSGGALTSVGVTTSTGAASGPNSVAVDPSGRFLYTANVGTNDVSQFSINQSTGVLTSIAANVASGSNAAAVTVDPTGRFAFVANASGASVAAFTINPTTGALTIVGTNVAAGSGPAAVSVEPSGRWLYVANNGDGNVQQFSIASTGALTFVSTATTGTQPEGIAIDPLGRFEYVVNNAGLTGNTVSGFTLGASGGLTAITGSPFAAGNTPYSVAVDVTGSFAYVPNLVDNDVQAYSINQTTGVLTSLGTTTAVPSTNPRGVATTFAIQ